MRRMDAKAVSRVLEAAQELGLLYRPESEAARDTRLLAWSAALSDVTEREAKTALVELSRGPREALHVLRPGDVTELVFAERARQGENRPALPSAAPFWASDDQEALLLAVIQEHGRLEGEPTLHYLHRIAVLAALVPVGEETLAPYRCGVQGCEVCA